jgi:hypothetical protein
MSLFDSASLVVTPNGTKASKLYAIKPTDGSGDLSVVRATSATRVDANGLVEIPRTNLFLQSNVFNNASWVKLNSSATLTSIQSPILGENAYLYSITNLSNYINQAKSIANSPNTISIFVKKNIGSLIQLNLGSNFAIFNLDTQVFSNVTNCVPSFESFSNGWFRISIFANVTTNLSAFINIPNTASISDSVYISCAQLEQGVSATEYIPTVASIRTKFAGITQDGSSASNIPRLDYTNGSCPSILVEPQRTNLILRSEEFNNTSWNVASTSTVTLNAGISPSGNNTANLITATALDGRRIQSVSLTAGTYTYSYFVKKGNQSSIQVLAFNSTLSAVAQSANFDLDNGTLTSGTGIIQQFANGWYRVSVTFVIAATNTILLYIKSGLSNNAIGSTVYAWGAQLEAGANATSYIPTTSASVTRNADVFSVSLPNTDMTFCAYLELAEPTLGSNTGDWLQIYNNVSILGRGYGYAQAVGFADAYVLGATASSSRKIIWKQESGTTAKIFLDGVLVATSTTGTYSNPFNRLGIFGEHLSKPAKINMFTFFNENLTDAQCIELTTL